MRRTIFLVVEGFTEEQFCNSVLKKYFESKGLFLCCAQIITSQKDSKPAHRGGGISIEKLCDNLGHVKNDNYLVSTLVDYYGFINPNEKSIDELIKDLKKSVEKKYSEALKYNNFIPYIQNHEIEAFLFCNPEITLKYLGVYFNKSEKAKALKKLRDNLKNKDPEDINNGRDTAPSKRIREIFKQYNKGNLDFSNIVMEIGIENIKNSCPRFNNWLNELENKA